jgi:3-hydroxybutyryl-CoA dehydrogenase
MNEPVIALVGAGRMGVAIAYVLANAGNEIRLFDTSPTVLARAQHEIARIAALCATAIPRITTHETLQGAARTASLVIEAATENVRIKREIFAQLETIVSPTTVLATNTSSIPLHELTPVLAHPERFVGTHFWNPAYAVKLVEIVGHSRCAESALQFTLELLTGASFHPVRVRMDVPGLIGNRLQHALKREAIALVAAGVCDAETVDTVAKLTLGRRLAVLGPLEQSDMVGLDLTVAIHQTLLPDLDRSAHVQPYLVSLVEQGHLGMKTGRGFRAWTPTEAAAVRDQLDRHLLKKDTANQ